MNISSFYFRVFLLCTILTRCQGVPGSRVALLIFGDSLLDSGNNNYLKNPIGQANFWPYGESFFKHPTGRFTDGRVIPDFIAEHLKLPFLPPYLQPGDKDFTVGVNFASGGAGALIQTYQGRVVDLPTQLKYFKNVTNQLRKKVGDAETKGLLSKAIYMFSIGGNDYLVPLVVNRNSSVFELYTKKEYVSMVIGNLTTVIKGIYQNGGRKFVIMTVPPLGRLPYTRAYNNGSATPELMELTKLHNKALSRALKQLQKELKDFKYVIFYLYNVLGDMISHPSKYGFKDSTEACCGSGLYRGTLCGRDGYELCKDVAGHVFFDGGHASEIVYKQSAEFIWNGNSDVIWPHNLKTLVAAN